MSIRSQPPCRLWVGLIFALSISACGWFDSSREKAAAHLAKGNFAAARIEAANAIQKDERDAEAHFLLGRALLGQGQFAPADASLKRAAVLGVDTAQVDAVRSRALLKLRAYDRILKELDPAPGHAGEALALVLAARGQAELAISSRDKARLSFQKALDVVPELPEARIGQAQLALSENNPDEAMASVERVINRSPRHADAWQMKAIVLQSQGKIDEAIKAFEQAASNDPASIEAPLAAAELSMALKQFGAAQKYIQEADKRFPNAVAVRYMQALLHFQQRQYSETVNLLQEVLKEQPNAVPSNTLAGAAHLAQGDLKQAEERFRTVLRATPHHALAQRLLAVTALRQGRTKEALEMLRPALERGPDDPRLLAVAAEAHVHLKEYAKATAYFEKAAELSAHRADSLTRVGMAKIAEGREAEGLSMLEKAASSSTDDVSADIALATVLIRRGEFQNALAAAKVMQSQAPRNPIGFNLAGVALLKLNDVPAARTMFERAADVDPGFWPAAAQLARLDLAVGNRDAAKARIQRVLAKDANNIQSLSTLLHITGDRGQFIESLEMARRADPKAIAPRVVLAREYLARGLGERALHVAREVMAAAPERPDAAELLGTAQLAAGRHNEALTTFRDLERRFPNSAVVHTKLAAALAGSGDLRGAENEYRKAMSLQPSDYAPMVGLVKLYQRERRFDDAHMLARNLQDSHPKSATGHVLAGDLYLSAGRYPSAIKAYADAFEREPSAQTLIGQHVARTRANERVEDAPLVQWLEKHPNDLAVRMYLAHLRFISGQYREASKYYEEVVKLDPNRAAAWNNLASTYLKLKDERALPAAQAAYDLNPDDGSILDTLGVAQTRYGKANVAVDTLKKAMSRRPDSTETQINYALALAKSGDRASGRAELRKIVAKNLAVVLDDEAKAILQDR